MSSIPAVINGVAVEISSKAANAVDPRMVEGLDRCIRADVAAGHVLKTIWISSASEDIPEHKHPSRHAQQKAVDISRINGIKIVMGYPSDPAVKAIVDAIQLAFEKYAHRRENFGPKIKQKLGKKWSVDGHRDHIHLSVN